MGRGHLIRFAGVLAISLALAAAASAAAPRVVTWHLLTHGIAKKSDGATPIGILAPSKAAAQRLQVRVPAAALKSVLRLDYTRRVALGIFGEFGCYDNRVRIVSIEQVASVLRVRLQLRPLPTGTVECFAVFPTFRLLSLDRSDLGPSLPTRVSVTLART